MEPGERHPRHLLGLDRRAALGVSRRGRRGARLPGFPRKASGGRAPLSKGLRAWPRVGADQATGFQLTIPLLRSFLAQTRGRCTAPLISLARQPGIVHLLSAWVIRPLNTGLKW